MQRILVVVVVLIVVWRILASIGRRLTEREPGADSFSRFSPEARRRRRQWSEGAQGRVEELVECHRCGTFVPAGRALTSGDQSTYCSDECRRQATVTPTHAGG
jgi:hypothetical protein